MPNEEQEMLDKAEWFDEKISHLKDTRDYYYNQIGIMEEAKYKADLAKQEMIHKIMELNDSINNFEKRRRKEINFLDINLNRGMAKENDTNSK